MVLQYRSRYAAMMVAGLWLCQELLLRLLPTMAKITTPPGQLAILSSTLSKSVAVHILYLEGVGHELCTWVT